MKINILGFGRSKRCKTCKKRMAYHDTKIRYNGMDFCCENCVAVYIERKNDNEKNNV